METAPLWAAAIVPLILFSLSVYIMGLFSYKNYFPVDGRVRSLILLLFAANAELGRLLSLREDPRVWD